MALAFKAKLIEAKLAAATINRRLSALRSLVHVARVLGMVPWLLEVENMPSQPYRDTRGPGREGVQALLDELAKRRDAKGARDTAIVRLCYDLALRRAEITALDLVDIDMKAGTVEVLGKGKFERIKLSLPDETKEVLASWIKVRGEAAGALLTNVDHRPAHRGKRIAGNSVRRIIARLGDAAGVRARPHGLRHAGITEGLDKTKDPRAAQRFSRHSKFDTMLIYDDNRQDLGGEVARTVAAGVRHGRLPVAQDPKRDDECVREAASAVSATGQASRSNRSG